jgi:hypothetical protein
VRTSDEGSVLKDAKRNTPGPVKEMDACSRSRYSPRETTQNPPDECPDVVFPDEGPDVVFPDDVFPDEVDGKKALLLMSMR